MGGREFSLLVDGKPPIADEATIHRVLEEQLFLLPSVVEGSGPFPDRHAAWSKPADSFDASTRFVVVSFYLALMTAECLALAGAEGDIVVEGPFAGNELFLAMLGAATRRPVVPMRASATGTSIGAAMLAVAQPMPRLNRGEPIVLLPARATAMAAYAEHWRSVLGD